MRPAERPGTVRREADRVGARTGVAWPSRELGVCTHSAMQAGRGFPLEATQLVAGQQPADTEGRKCRMAPSCRPWGTLWKWGHRGQGQMEGEDRCRGGGTPRRGWAQERRDPPAQKADPEEGAIAPGERASAQEGEPRPGAGGGRRDGQRLRH